MMRISHNGLVEIEASEGFSSRPYLDTVASPPVWTTGFGETDGIGPHTKAITRAEAERRLIARFEKQYAWALEPFLAIPGFNQNIYDALASFIWNCGTGSVSTDTKVGRALRAGQWHAAAEYMQAWCKNGAGVVIKGLQDRRERERDLMLKPVTVLAFLGYTPHEVEMIREYDRLLHAKQDIARRRELRERMAVARKRIWRKAQPKAAGGDGRGWDYGHRRQRWHSLDMRS